MKSLFFSALALIFICSAPACKKTVTEIQQVNQAFSARYTITPGEWLATNDGSPGWYKTLNVPEIDDKIVADGGVIVYLSFDDGKTYEALPEVYGIRSYGAIHVAGQVTIDIHAVDGGTVDAPSDDVTAKIVLIDAEGLPN